MSRTPTDSLSSIISESEVIDFHLVYTLHTFVATLDGQLCSTRNDKLKLLDDTNAYWWLVRCIKSHEVGYIPAESIELATERLARLNRQRNGRAVESLEFLQMKKETYPETLIWSYTPAPVVIQFAVMHTLYFMSDSEDEGSDWSDGAGEGDVVAVPAVLKVEVGSPTKQADSTSPIYKKVKAISQSLHIIRVHRGALNVAAEFKTISLTSTNTCADIVKSLYKKFRITEATPSDYYLTIFILDSDTDILLDVLTDFKKKASTSALPGFSTQHSLDSMTAKLQTLDESFIKFLLNKRVEDKREYVFMRVYLAGQLKAYKTVGFEGEKKIQEVVEMARRKFKLLEGRVYTLYSYQDRREVLLGMDEMCHAVIEKLEGQGELFFIIKQDGGTEVNTATKATLIDEVEAIQNTVHEFMIEKRSDDAPQLKAAPPTYRPIEFRSTLSLAEVKPDTSLVELRQIFTSGDGLSTRDLSMRSRSKSLGSEMLRSTISLDRRALFQSRSSDFDASQCFLDAERELAAIRKELEGMNIVM